LINRYNAKRITAAARKYTAFDLTFIVLRVDKI
jgi:hypothetical protein